MYKLSISMCVYLCVCVWGGCAWFPKESLRDKTLCMYVFLRKFHRVHGLIIYLNSRNAQLSTSRQPRLVAHPQSHPVGWNYKLPVKSLMYTEQYHQENRLFAMQKSSSQQLCSCKLILHIENWGFVRDFAKGHDLSAQRSTPAHFMSQLLSAVFVFGIKLWQQMWFAGLGDI